MHWIQLYHTQTFSLKGKSFRSHTRTMTRSLYQRAVCQFLTISITKYCASASSPGLSEGKHMKRQTALKTLMPKHGPALRHVRRGDTTRRSQILCFSQRFKQHIGHKTEANCILLLFLARVKCLLSQDFSFVFIRTLNLKSSKE